MVSASAPAGAARPALPGLDGTAKAAWRRHPREQRAQRCRGWVARPGRLDAITRRWRNSQA
ncbi:hypothetical protein [Vreelandella zhanjiangensis]|uniref:hypothetical protein n=1 Tax=Vreelandella zhanjiangensis TaxID=1121960 RepID=UPI00039BEE77|nr:hypothetical protein [Halomonas zhanjiangensis]